MMSAVAFDPRNRARSTDFEITNVSEERRTPLDFKALLDAERKAVADEDEFKQEEDRVSEREPAGARSHRQAGARPRTPR